MESCIYQGRVRHRRRVDVAHEFEYGLYMMYLDLDELPELFAGRWLWSVSRPAVARFQRRDHLGSPQRPLSQEVRRLVHGEAGIRLEGPIRLLTHLRYLGYGFNPVSFYYCFDAAGERLEAIVAEVNNTPWGQQHCYVLSQPEKGPGRLNTYHLAKQFHVSPFLPMDMQYRWRFSRPADNLLVHTENYRGGALCFDATLRLERKPITAGTLAGVLLRFPLMTARVVGAIHYQALRLWIKRAPFYPHPNPDKQLFRGEP